MTLAVGERIGRYHLDEDLGQGAIGPVFAATDTRNDRKVVVRSVGEELIGDRGLWKKLREAAGRVRRLDHPVPAKVVDVVDTPTAKAIIEEHIEGHTLGQELDHRGGTLPLHRAYAVFVQLAEAVQAAHDMDLPHWRLNPQSVMLSRQDNREQIRITGFGVGLALTEAGLAAAATKSMPVHLAYYLAPDQAHRGMTPSPRSDVYALGVMLYEALTGYVPFGGDDVYQVVRGHLMDPPPPPRGLVADLPWHVEAVVLLALAKHPDDRIESSRELAMYLRGCASGAIVPSPEAPAVTPVPTAPTPLGGNGIRIRREGPPPAPLAVTPLPMTQGFAATPDEEEDVPTKVRSLADFPDMDDAGGTAGSLPSDGSAGDDHEDTNPSLSIIDDDDLILMEGLDTGLQAVSDFEATTPASPAPLVDSEAEPAELPDGVPNPSYLALLAPRG